MVSMMASHHNLALSGLRVGLKFKFTDVRRPHERSGGNTWHGTRQGLTGAADLHHRFPNTVVITVKQPRRWQHAFGGRQRAPWSASGAAGGAGGVQRFRTADQQR